ncbi:unnamed protein product, partial [Adineta steineri]
MGNAFRRQTPANYSGYGGEFGGGYGGNYGGDYGGSCSERPGNGCFAPQRPPT